MKKKLLIFMLFLTSVLFAQQQQQPKVGLVLSGGGAKGFAHIGVLKAIEKSGIKLDYIAGTSMGAIIGAFYASGFSAAQIEELIRTTNFNELLQDKIPRQYTPLFDKINQEKYALSVPITKNGISLPKAMSKGQNVRNYFSKLFSPLENITDFSKLPIPFLCVATDIETGDKVVLEKGSLNTAVLASGAFPTLLYPVEIDGKLLIDGGVADNFPAIELRKKGMDIIIGSDVQNDLAKRDKLGSAIDLLNQIVAFQIYRESELQKKEVDIYVHPNTDGFSVISFDAAAQIIKNGEIAANKKIAQLDSISKLQLIKNKVKQQIVEKNQNFKLGKVEIIGNLNYNRDYILGSMDLRAGDEVSTLNIVDNVNKLYATRNFANIDYTFSHPSEGKRNMTLKIEENQDRSFFKFAIHYDNLFGTGLLTNFTQKRILTNNDIFSLDVVFGDKLRYDLNYFIDNGQHWGFGIQSSYKKLNANVDSYNQKINRLNMNFSEILNRIYIQTKFNRKYALTIGADYRILQASSETILIDNKPVFYEDGAYGLLFANLKIDNFNKSYYPTKGMYFSSTFSWVPLSDRNKTSTFINTDVFKPFTQLVGKFSAVNTLFKKFTMQHTFEGGITMGNFPTDAFTFKIGSYNKNLFYNFIRFYGFDLAEFNRNNFLKAEAEFRYNFYKKHHLIANANFIRMDKRNFLEGGIFDNIYAGYAVGYGLETFFGPIELKYSWAPESSRKGFLLFNLGFWF